MRSGGVQVQVATNLIDSVISIFKMAECFPASCSVTQQELNNSSNMRTAGASFDARQRQMNEDYFSLHGMSNLRVYPILTSNFQK